MRSRGFQFPLKRPNLSPHQAVGAERERPQLAQQRGPSASKKALDPLLLFDADLTTRVAGWDAGTFRPARIASARGRPLRRRPNRHRATGCAPNARRRAGTPLRVGVPEEAACRKLLDTARSGKWCVIRRPTPRTSLDPRASHPRAGGRIDGPRAACARNGAVVSAARSALRHPTRAASSHRPANLRHGRAGCASPSR